MLLLVLHWMRLLHIVGGMDFAVSVQWAGWAELGMAHVVLQVSVCRC